MQNIVTHRPLRALGALLVLATAVLVACGRGEAPEVAVPSSATISPPPGATAPALGPASSATASVTSTPSAPASPPSATPSTATPQPSATPGGERVASTASTARSALPVAEFAIADGTVVRLPIEVPPPTEYGIGLSGRRSLDERGMLFYFPQTGRVSFWMKDTHIDLSIAFVTTDERIVDIREMQAESPALVTPAADYRYAIEAPKGWFARNRVSIGDTARLNFPLPKSITGG